MAKNKVQKGETEVEIVSPEVENKESKKKEKTKDSKKETKAASAKVDNTKAKAKAKSNKDNKEKKSVKKKAAEVFSELKKVSKPSFGKVVKNTCVVIAVVAICTVLLFGVDRLFSLVNDLLLP